MSTTSWRGLRYSDEDSVLRQECPCQPARGFRIGIRSIRIDIDLIDRRWRWLRGTVQTPRMISRSALRMWDFRYAVTRPQASRNASAAAPSSTLVKSSTLVNVTTPGTAGGYTAAGFVEAAAIAFIGAAVQFAVVIEPIPGADQWRIGSQALAIGPARFARTGPAVVGRSPRHVSTCQEQSGGADHATGDNPPRA